VGQAHMASPQFGNTINDTLEHPGAKQLGVMLEIGPIFMQNLPKLIPGSGYNHHSARIFQDQSINILVNLN